MVLSNGDVVPVLPSCIVLEVSVLQRMLQQHPQLRERVLADADMVSMHLESFPSHEPASFRASCTFNGGRGGLGTNNPRPKDQVLLQPREDIC